MGYGCKDSAKFRLNEENANIFVFLSGRNLFKSSKIPKENLFFFVFLLDSLPKGGDLTLDGKKRKLRFREHSFLNIFSRSD